MGHYQRVIPRCSWIAALALVSVALSGCFGAPGPEVPTVFRIDEVRYWFEGDHLVINVTFHNQVNLTPGENTFSPRLEVSLGEFEAKKGQEGEQLRRISFRSIYLTFSYQNSSVNDPWQQRWYHNHSIAEAEATMGLTSSSDFFVGPMQILPNQSISPEFAFRTENNFSGVEGYYVVDVRIPSHYPRSYGQDYWGADAAVHYTGCFNRNVAEFYGVKEGAPDCQYWDCTGDSTSSQHYFPDRRESALPDCSASKGTGIR